MSGWTEDEDATLKQCIADLLSASETSDRLGGRSRNSCIGRAHRLGLHFGSEMQPSRPRLPRPRKPSKPPVPKAEPVIDAAPVALPAPKPEPREYARVRFLDVRFDQCRWFPADHGAESLVCGQPVKPGHSYCAKHHARVYVPMSARNNSQKGKQHARAGY